MGGVSQTELILNRYSLLRPLGNDGLASIFLARTEGAHGFRKAVLLRLVHPHVVASPGGRMSLIREADVTSQLVHPNIVQTIDFGEHEEHYVEVTEYVHGYELASLAGFRARHNQPWPLELVAYLMLKLLRAVAFAHEQVDRTGQPMGIIHSFISPHNILVSSTGHIKMGGFGVADTRSELSLQSLNKLVKGKLAYQSPEQIGGHTVDQRTDLFSLATVFFELLAGIRLFHSDISEAETVKNVLRASIPNLQSIRPGLPPAVSDIVARGLARDPERRIATAREFADEINSLIPAAAVGTLAESFEQNIHEIINNQQFREFAPPLFDLDRALAGEPLAARYAVHEPSELTAGFASTDQGTAPAARRRLKGNRRFLLMLSMLFAIVVIVGAMAITLKSREVPAEPANIAVIVERSGSPPTEAPPTEAPPTEAPPTRQTIDGAAVSRLLHRRQGQLRQCVQTHAAGAANVTVRVQIDGQGSARTASILPSSVGESPLGACLNQVVRRVRFPAHGGTPLTYSVPLFITAN
jgi:hypothetical protein